MENSRLNFNKSLDDLYADINNIYKKMENSQLSSNSAEYQKNVADGIEISSFLWKNVQELELFSNNETLDDMTTESLKYVIVPAMIGYFVNHKSGNSRLEILNEVKKFYSIFQELIVDYGFKNNQTFQTESESRENKIKQYKENKLLNDKLTLLEKYISDGKAEEEIIREYYLMLIQQWHIRVKNDSKFLAEEIQIVQNKSNANEQSIKDVEIPNLKSFVITKNMVTNTVFGMGYKNLPKYTLEDFYRYQVENGLVPYPSDEKQKSNNSGTVNRIVPGDAEADEADAVKKDSLEDSHDLNERLRQMNWDDFKDENRRGCGNTTNRG